MRLKRWESPRRQGRNDKGKGGSARKRQLKKQQQMLRQKLKAANEEDTKQIKSANQGKKTKYPSQGEENLNFPLFFGDFKVKQEISLYNYLFKYTGLRSSRQKNIV